MCWQWDSFSINKAARLPLEATGNPASDPLPLFLTRDCFLGLQRDLGEVLAIAAFGIESYPAYDRWWSRFRRSRSKGLTRGAIRLRLPGVAVIPQRRLAVESISSE